MQDGCLAVGLRGGNKVDVDLLAQLEVAGKHGVEAFEGVVGAGDL